MNEQEKEFDLAEDRPIEWAAIVTRVWRQRKLIALFVGIATLLSVVVSLLLTPLYTARTSILPELSKERTLGLAGLQSLAEATGLNVGETPVSKLYPMIVKSERILKEVLYTQYKTKAFAREVNLIEYWDISGDSQNEILEKALKKIRNRMDVTFDMRLGTVSIEVDMEEPELAADVANRITAELDQYTRTKRTTNATLQREFIEQRLKDVEEALKKSEVVLKEFREKNRKVADSPQLMMEQERLAREVEINSTVFIELKKQLEIAKIEEIKNIPLINVLDPARPPAKKSYPVRSIIVLVTFFISFVLGTGYSVASDSLKEAYTVISQLITSNASQA